MASVAFGRGRGGPTITCGIVVGLQLLGGGVPMRHNHQREFKDHQSSPTTTVPLTLRQIEAGLTMSVSWIASYGAADSLTQFQIDLRLNIPPPTVPHEIHGVFRRHLGNVHSAAFLRALGSMSATHDALASEAGDSIEFRALVQAAGLRRVVHPEQADQNVFEPDDDESPDGTWLILYVRSVDPRYPGQFRLALSPTTGEAALMPESTEFGRDVIRLFRSLI